MDEPAPNHRDPHGRFAAGNPGGPGGSRRRASDLRRAAEEAVTPEMVRGVLRKVAMQALQGNLTASRILLERTLGRAAEVPTGEALGIKSPRLATAADCTAALQKVTDAICEGIVDPAIGKVLLDAITAQAKLIEVGDLEARLAELEKAAAQVDLGRRA